MAANALKDSVSPPKDDKAEKKKAEKKEVDYSGVDLSKLAMIAAGALGVVGGLFIGIAKTVRAWATLFVPNIVDSWDNFGKSIDTFVKDVKASLGKTKTAFIESIDNFVKDVKTSLGKTKTSFTNQWNKLMDGMTRFFANQFARVKTFFSVADDGKIAKLMTSINRRFKGFTNMLSDVGDMIKSLWQKSVGKIISKVQSTGKLIKNIMFKFNKFANIAGKIGRLVGKLFLPLTIVMTAFDTIQGAIDGFNKDGWWGAIEGGINALFTSLIFMPLDLLTDGVEWLLRKMGFDDEADILKGFSWTKLWNDVVGEMFANVRKLVDSLFNIFAVATDPDKTWTDLLFAGWEYVKDWWDILFYPVKGAIKWLMKKFVWSDEEAEKKDDFQFTDLVGDLIEKGADWIAKKIEKIWEDIKTSFTDAFDIIRNMIPSLEDIKQIAWDNTPALLKKAAPDWIKPMSVRTQGIRDEISEKEKELENFVEPKRSSFGRVNRREKMTKELEELRKELAIMRGGVDAAANGPAGGAVMNYNTTNNYNSNGTSVTTGNGPNVRASPHPI